MRLTSIGAQTKNIFTEMESSIKFFILFYFYYSINGQWLGYPVPGVFPPQYGNNEFWGGIQPGNIYGRNDFQNNVPPQYLIQNPYPSFPNRHYNSYNNNIPYATNIQGATEQNSNTPNVPTNEEHIKNITQTQQTDGQVQPGLNTQQTESGIQNETNNSQLGQEGSSSPNHDPNRNKSFPQPNQYGTNPSQNQYGTNPSQNQYGTNPSQNQYGTNPSQNQYNWNPQLNQPYHQYPQQNFYGPQYGSQPNQNGNYPPQSSYTQQNQPTNPNSNNGVPSPPENFSLDARLEDGKMKEDKPDKVKEGSLTTVKDSPKSEDKLILSDR